MKLSNSSSSQLKATIQKAIGRFMAENETYVTDLHVQTNSQTGVCKLFDDDDNELGHTTVKEWVAYEGDDFDDVVTGILTTLLQEMKNAGDFNRLSIIKPFSFVYVDDDKETIAELLLMDDDTLIVTDELLKGLDDELNQFLKDLLADE
ncbi:MAG: hypothetical protein K5856_02250 [Bacteroidaceae bacterium]|nr:hypothetical protein [Bacteroidaceae bacterium]